MILDECKDLTDQIAKKRQLRIHVEQLKRYQKGAQTCSPRMPTGSHLWYPFVKPCATRVSAMSASATRPTVSWCPSMKFERNSKRRRSRLSVIVH